MAYDERYHLEVIKIYTNRIHPFWSGDPSGPSPYGALSRDPSYLYHYIMSLPMRVIELLTDDPRLQITILRFISIGLFITGIYIFRKVLRSAGCSKALSNVVLAMFAATPLVSLLAAQINYDNLLIVVFGLALLLMQRILASLPKNLEAKNLMLLAIVAMAGALIKYAFLPILLGIGLVLLVAIFKGKKNTIDSRWQEIRSSFTSIPKRLRIVLCIAFVLLFGLCLERYAVNLVRYKTPAPECDQVLTIEQCFANGPWRRNYQTRRSKLNGTLKPRDTSFKRFAIHSWLSVTTYQLFYVLNGEQSGYALGWAYSNPRKASVVVFLAGTVLYIIFQQRIRKKYRFDSLIIITLLYCSTLLLQNYSDLRHLGYPFGIQGRYLIPILPIVYAVVASGFAVALGKWQSVKTILAIIAILGLITQGGGAGTFVLRSDNTWYWNDANIITGNNRVRRVLQKFIIE